jgi:outer membrane protein assembly factor BamB
VDPPTSWDATKSNNIKWKTFIPGLGHSSPVIWDDKVFLTTAVSTASKTDFLSGPTQTIDSAKDNGKHSWRVLCLNKITGKIIWERVASEGIPKSKRHLKASHANCTPVTDGRYLVAMFGSEGLYCFDLRGKLIWKKSLGVLDGGWTSDPQAHWGFASSPVIYRNLVIVQCDTQTRSFIAAYGLQNGEQVWRNVRDEDTSWSTPTIYEGKPRDELIVSGTKYYRGYDLLTGAELWRLRDGADVKIPTPITANGLIYLGGGSSHGRRVFYAIRAGATGDISLRDGKQTNPSIAWHNRAVPHILTPIVYNNYLYVCTDNGVLMQYDATTGERTYTERLGGRGSSFTASPVAANGKLYFVNEDGDVFVVTAGREYALLATNPIGEVVMSTPAISRGLLIVRGRSHVFAIGSH